MISREITPTMTLNKDTIINENPNRDKWSEFVFNHPYGNIFQIPETFDVFKETPNFDSGIIAIENLNKDILGVLLYTIVHEPGLKSHFSARSIISGGPLIKDDDIELTKQILSAYTKKINKTNIIYTEVRNLFDLKYIHPAFIDSQFKYEDHLTIHMDLTQSIDQLQNALHRGRASNIKRAIKKNVIVKDITSKDGINNAFKLIEETYKRINLPSPSFELFYNAHNILQNNIKITGAYLDDKLIGCRVYLIYKGVMFDWYAAIDKAYSNLQASDLLPWENMLWGKNNGLKIYDFAGAGKPDIENSIRDYKLKFGGYLLNLGRYKFIHKPLLFNIGKFGMKFYKHIR